MKFSSRILISCYFSATLFQCFPGKTDTSTPDITQNALDRQQQGGKKAHLIMGQTAPLSLIHKSRKNILFHPTFTYCFYSIHTHAHQWAHQGKSGVLSKHTFTYRLKELGTETLTLQMMDNCTTATKCKRNIQICSVLEKKPIMLSYPL